LFHKIIIANRGEIAVRIIRTCKEMGIKTVAVYSDADADSLHVKLADESYLLGPSEAQFSYLNAEKILEVAEKSEAEALHPGYGFLAENPQFVETCEQKGITFIGPPSQCMKKAKPKQQARQLMRMLNIPVVPGYDEPLMESTQDKVDQIQKIAEEIGYPIIFKPAGGGGGIGMITVKNKNELANAIRSVEQRGQKVFGVSSFYIEKYMTDIKHIEFQILADKYGNVISLGERDCSIQRRFQKLIEEAPCSMISPHLRMKMGAAAIDIALAMQYVNALTVEFFYLPQTKQFYFNEVNTRLQVEHCVTELVTGIDIVKEQICIAAGEQLHYLQDDIIPRGFAIECRISAEDVNRNFIPNPGQITELRLPHGIGLRIDEGIYNGYSVPYFYDPLLMKIMTWGKTRDEALARMRRAMDEIEINGLKTTIPFHRKTLDDAVFRSGMYTTDFVEKRQIIRKLQNQISI
jgi:acetyl-CoA carboxylase, biotin carboxylase subunit